MAVHLRFSDLHLPAPKHASFPHLAENGTYPLSLIRYDSNLSNSSQRETGVPCRCRRHRQLNCSSCVNYASIEKSKPGFLQALDLFVEMTVMALNNQHSAGVQSGISASGFGLLLKLQTQVTLLTFCLYE